MNPRRILMLLVAGLIMTGCSKALTAQVSSDATLSGINGDDRYPSSCGTSTRPSWCAGSDMGAWIN
jgi:pectin methylesterase-like acyl-CoA thioesterase